MSFSITIDVDLYSDTVTRPTADMRRFMCEAEGVSLDPSTVETNIVFFELTGELTAPVAVERMLAHGVHMGALGLRTARAVTHLDVDADAAGIERALAAARVVFSGRER